MTPIIRVCYSPNGSIAARIIASIESAKLQIRCAMYEFSDGQIADALIRAHLRGVDVRVILDPCNAHLHDTCLPKLLTAGINTRTDNQHAICHLKLMVLDAMLTITGSYNYTIAAEYRNAEDCMFIADPTTASSFLTNWQLHASHSIPSTL